MVFVVGVLGVLTALTIIAIRERRDFAERVKRLNTPPFPMEYLDRLNTDMTMEQVKELLGEPFEVHAERIYDTDEPYEVWHYRHPQAFVPTVDIYFTPQGRLESYISDT